MMRLPVTIFSFVQIAPQSNNFSYVTHGDSKDSLSSMCRVGLGRVPQLLSRRRHPSIAIAGRCYVITRHEWSCDECIGADCRQSAGKVQINAAGGLAVKP